MKPVVFLSLNTIINNTTFFIKQYDLTCQLCQIVTLLFDRHYNTVTVIFGQDYETVILYFGQHYQTEIFFLVNIMKLVNS